MNIFSVVGCDLLEGNIPACSEQNCWCMCLVCLCLVLPPVQVGWSRGEKVSATIPAVAHLAAWGRAAPEKAPENVPGCFFAHENKRDVVRTAPCLSFA